jgi:rod shape-determining protein MreC
MESFFTRYKNALVLMLVVLAQVILLAMQVRRPAPNMQDGHNIRLWRYWVAGLVTPPEKLAHGIGLKVRGVWSNYVYLRNLREQNESLQDENIRLRLEQASLAEDAREGQRLREMLDFRAAYIDTTVPAQVIGTSGTDQAHVIYIDKGSKEGIRPQMPVITPDGVVGKVKNVFPGTSQVLLISDQTSGAGVMLQTTRIRGVMKGNVAGQPQMINISPDERIQPGEVVLTSGGDQVYPRGLPVGVVEKVVPDPDTSYVNVVVKPNANLAKLEEVMVITAVSVKMPFGEEKDMMQSEVDAYAEKERAADILSEKLPSLRDAETAESKLAGDASGDSSGDASGAAPATAGGGDPARPMRPPQPLHSDRYTPGAAPAAADLTPGQGPPVKYPTAVASEAAAPKAVKSGGGNGATGTGAGTLATETAAVPKSRFPPKPSTVVAPMTAAASSSAAGGSGTGSPVAKPTLGVASTTAAKPALGAASTGNAGSALNGTARPVSRMPGTGLSYPLQPATSNTTQRAVSPSAAAGTGAAPAESGTTVVRTPRPATTGSAAGTTGLNGSAGGNGTGGARAGSSGGNGFVANGSGAAGASAPAASRKIVIPSDSGGILTPAGMGSIVAAPRPRPTTPAVATSAGTAGPSGTHPSTTAKPASPTPSTGSGTGTLKPSADKPQTPKPQTPAQQPATRPQAAPPGGF